jgi:hypothetical protein
VSSGAAKIEILAEQRADWDAFVAARSGAGKMEFRLDHFSEDGDPRRAKPAFRVTARYRPARVKFRVSRKEKSSKHALPSLACPEAQIPHTPPKQE